MTDKPRFQILSEEVVHREGMPDVENPYWLAEEPEPHPDPERGCIRRGICCRTSPGWFAPGEVEKAAELKGLSPDEFVRKFLVIDSYELDGEVVYTFAPVKLDRTNRPAIPTASRVDDLYRALRGTCIFFKHEGCSIYDARPAECAAYVCTNEDDENLSHRALAEMWKAHQAG